MSHLRRFERQHTGDLIHPALLRVLSHQCSVDEIDPVCGLEAVYGE